MGIRNSRGARGPELLATESGESDNLPINLTIVRVTYGIAAGAGRKYLPKVGAYI